MKCKLDKAKLDNLLRLFRKYKKGQDHDIYMLILNESDSAFEFKHRGSVLRFKLVDVLDALFTMRNPSNEDAYDVLRMFNFKIVEPEPYMSEDGVPF